MEANMLYQKEFPEPPRYSYVNGVFQGTRYTLVSLPIFINILVNSDSVWRIYLLFIMRDDKREVIVSPRDIATNSDAIDWAIDFIEKDKINRNKGV